MIKIFSIIINHKESLVFKGECPIESWHSSIIHRNIFLHTIEKEHVGFNIDQITVEGILIPIFLLWVVQLEYSKRLFLMAQQPKTQMVVTSTSTHVLNMVRCLHWLLMLASTPPLHESQLKHSLSCLLLHVLQLVLFAAVLAFAGASQNVAFFFVNPHCNGGLQHPNCVEK